MLYRTRTYLAAEWDGDKDAIEQLQKWNDNDFWSLSFTNAHDLTQARDGSLNCSIKASLTTRFNGSKTFVLIVGDNTNNVRSGSCSYCPYYNIITGCSKNKHVDFKSYIQYECEKAIRDNLKIVVLYKAARVIKTNCPDTIKDVGVHIPMLTLRDGKYYWDYQAVKNAIK